MKGQHLYKLLFPTAKLILRVQETLSNIHRYWSCFKKISLNYNLFHWEDSSTLVMLFLIWTHHRPRCVASSTYNWFDLAPKFKTIFILFRWWSITTFICGFVFVGVHTIDVSRSYIYIYDFFALTLWECEVCRVRHFLFLVIVTFHGSCTHHHVPKLQN